MPDQHSYQKPGSKPEEHLRKPSRWTQMLRDSMRKHEQPVSPRGVPHADRRLAFLTMKDTDATQHQLGFIDLANRPRASPQDTAVHPLKLRRNRSPFHFNAVSANDGNREPGGSAARPNGEHSNKTTVAGMAYCGTPKFTGEARQSWQPQPACRARPESEF
jgi:hypothetical protein